MIEELSQFKFWTIKLHLLNIRAIVFLEQDKFWIILKASQYISIHLIHIPDLMEAAQTIVILPAS
jgi:hypothetical protein